MANDKDFDVFEALNPAQEDRDLAAMLFAETAPPPAEATQTVVAEEALPQPVAEETPKKPGLLARLKGLFKKRASAPEETQVEAAPEEAETITEISEEASPPSRFNKKLLILVGAVITLVGAGIGGTALVFQHMDATRIAEQHKKEAQLAAEKAQLAAEKAQLEKQKADLAAKAQEQQTREKQAQESSPAAEQAVQKDMKAAAPGGPEAGDVDCAVVGKESAAQTIKRCIEAYNRATGRTK